MKPTINKTKENKKQKTHTQNRKNKKKKLLENSYISSIFYFALVLITLSK